MVGKLEMVGQNGRDKRKGQKYKENTRGRFRIVF